MVRLPKKGFVLPTLTCDEVTTTSSPVEKREIVSTFWVSIHSCACTTYLDCSVNCSIARVLVVSIYTRHAFIARIRVHINVYISRVK